MFGRSLGLTTAFTHPLENSTSLDLTHPTLRAPLQGGELHSQLSTLNSQLRLCRRDLDLFF
jgi:hypothetical protein